MAEPVILYRRGVVSHAEDEAEIDAARAAGLAVYRQRAGVPRGRLVVPRYAVWPFPGELAQDVAMLGSALVNDAPQMSWLRDIGAWAPVLGALTPQTWTWDAYAALARDPGPVVLKGPEKSRKDRWRTHMFAGDRAAAIAVLGRLHECGEDDVYVRRYVPLRKLADDLTGIPVAEEHRFFVLNGRVLCGGFYWASHVDELDRVPDQADVPRAFLADVVARVGDRARFYVVDVARTERGDWLMVELNDGCQSGLSTIPPADLYGALARALGSSGS